VSEPVSDPFAPLFARFREMVREVVREELRAIASGNGHSPALLKPEELAEKLNLPLSWIYERSRQGTMPTHRLGRYIRFDLQEVLQSQAYQKKVDIPS
jgi:excisionase family DNA binding protein